MRAPRWSSRTRVPGWSAGAEIWLLARLGRPAGRQLLAAADRRLRRQCLPPPQRRVLAELLVIAAAPLAGERLPGRLAQLVRLAVFVVLGEPADRDVAVGRRQLARAHRRMVQRCLELPARAALAELLAELAAQVRAQALGRLPMLELWLAYAVLALAGPLPWPPPLSQLISADGTNSAADGAVDAAVAS